MIQGSFKIEEGTTWWQPKPNAVIDGRDLAGLGVVVTTSTEGRKDYMLNVFMSGARTEDKREFHYVTLEELNAVLEPLGLSWTDADD